MFNDTDSGTYKVEKDGQESLIVEGEGRYGCCMDCSHAATILRSDGKLYRDCACTDTRIRKL